jgi:chemotaxis protein histidine kinase CheA
VRNGRLEVGSELIDLTLSALDQIRAMLEEGAGGAPADPAPARRFWPRCGNLAGNREKPAGARKKAPPLARCRTRAHAEWHIRFAPGPDLMLNGANPCCSCASCGSWEASR